MTILNTTIKIKMEIRIIPGGNMKNGAKKNTRKGPPIRYASNATLI